MINIISNVNPTITVEIVLNGALVERREFSLSRYEAKCVYVQLQDVGSAKWESSNEILNVLEKVKTDIFDGNDYEIYIKFEERFVAVLEKSYIEESMNCLPC